MSCASCLTKNLVLPKPRMFLKDFDTPVDRRWSELVPPRTALTFAAIWDEDEGMVTFSGAHLLDSETAEKGCSNRMTNDSPCDVPFGDGESQVLTINDRIESADEFETVLREERVEFIFIVGMNM